MGNSHRLNSPIIERCYRNPDLTSEEASMKRTAGIIVWLALCATCSLVAQSQLGTGAISGTVLDKSGAAIQDAAVQVTATETGLVRRVVTSSAGNFSIP